MRLVTSRVRRSSSTAARSCWSRWRRWRRPSGGLRRLPGQERAAAIGGCRCKGTAGDGGSSMAEQDQLLAGVHLLAAAALERWGLAGAPLRMINHSENVTYLVTPDGAARPAVLRVHRPGYHTINGIRSELAWIQALRADGGVATARAIPARDGAEIQVVEHSGSTRRCVLFEYLDGAAPDETRLVEPFPRLGEV